MIVCIGLETCVGQGTSFLSREKQEIENGVEYFCTIMEPLHAKLALTFIQLCSILGRSSVYCLLQHRSILTCLLLRHVNHLITLLLSILGNMLFVRSVS